LKNSNVNSVDTGKAIAISSSDAFDCSGTGMATGIDGLGLQSQQSCCESSGSGVSMAGLTRAAVKVRDGGVGWEEKK
jgi:hypothetical protein